jgi:hypothetical protein
MSVNTITYRRTELYDQVWKEPVRDSRYRISSPRGVSSSRLGYS